MSLMEHMVVHYRWVFVCIFLLPLSFLFDIWLYFRNRVVFALSSAPKLHDKKVKYVQRQVQEWIKNGKKTRLCTARPSWQTVSFRRAKYKKTFTQIEVNLVDILEVDTKRQVLRVEPMVTMGQLTATLNPLGWTIPIVPELDELTVGGLVMGTGIESASHKFGLFQHICLSFELVLSDGSVVTCSKDNNPELFYSVPWSYGTLGILTAVEIQMIPAKKFVKLTYEPIVGLENLDDEFRRVSLRATDDFVEGLVFSRVGGVVMTGNLVDKPEVHKINAIGKWHKPWFFKHVEGFLTRGLRGTEYIPLRDYYHRHSRSLFWELQDIIPFGNHPLFRFLLGWLMPPKISLLKLTQTQAITELYENHHIIQDMLVPIDKLQESILMFNREVEVYPLWLCPFMLPANPGMVHPQGNAAEMFVDIGVYGVPKVDRFRPKETTRAIEEYVVDVGGFQMLYADTYTTRKEFRKMFDHTLYDQVRQKLDCEQAFPEVYDKISREARD